MPLAYLHNAFAALVLGYNWSGDTGVVPLCHLLATNVMTCVWPTVVHPQIGAFMSCQALITPRHLRDDCVTLRGPISR